MILTLKRLAFLDDCTLGVLSIGNIPFCFTVERPWLNNKPNVSCIPAASYPVKWVITKTAGNRNGYGLGVENVDGRKLIRIHVANTADEVQGCIGVGLQRHDFTRGRGVSQSRAALSALMDMMDDKEAILHVHNPGGM
jgi:hypothetical protein